MGVVSEERWRSSVGDTSSCSKDSKGSSCDHSSHEALHAGSSEEQEEEQAECWSAAEDDAASSSSHSSMSIRDQS